MSLTNSRRRDALTKSLCSRHAHPAPRGTLVVLLLVLLGHLVGPSAAFAEESAPAEPIPTTADANVAAPELWTGKNDYVPNEYVDVNGSGWGSGEAIEIFVDDHEGKTWTHVATTTADELGNLYYEFRLPSWFVATYTLRATGEQSGVVETMFADSVAKVGEPFSNSNSGNENGTAAKRLTLSVPATTASQVAVVHVVVHKDLGAGLICPPSGWTSILRTVRSSGVYVQESFYRVGAAAASTGANSAEWTFRSGSCSGGTELGKGASGGGAVYDGVDLSTPVRASQGADGSGSSATAPSTAAAADDHVLRFFGLEKATTTPLTTDRLWIVSGSNVSARTSVGHGMTHASGATTGTFSITPADSGEWTAQTVVLRAAPTGPPADTTRPSVTINQASGQGDPTNETSIEFTAEFSEPVSGFTGADVNLSGSAGATTATVSGSGTTYTVSVTGMTSDGTVTASVPAGGSTDAAGNTNTASTSTDDSVSYDTTAPNTTITSGPSGSSNNASATFGFSSNETGSTFQCQLDSGGWGSCTSPKSYNDLAQGNHTFEVRAIDAVGNVDGSPASRTWTVDTSRPTVTINQASSQGDPTNETSIEFTAEFSEPVSGFTGADVNLSGSAGATTATVSGSGTTYTVSVTGMTSDGTVTASVPTGGSTDAAGNTNTASTSTDDSVSYDTTAPQTTIDTGPADPTNQTAPTLTFSADETGSTFDCRLDGATWDPCTTPTGYEDLTEGEHTFEVRATDRAGNTDQTPATHTWTIDTTAPQTTITHPIDGGAYSEASWNSGCGTPTGDICGEATDTGGSGVASVNLKIQRTGDGWYWTGTAWSPTPVTLTATGTPHWTYAFAYGGFTSSGSYTVTAWSVDHAGNTETSTAGSTWQLNRYTVDHLTPLDDSSPGTVVVNTGKNGRVIPVKVRVYLEGVNQTSTAIAEGSLTIGVTPTSCTAGAPTDSVEQYADAGASSAGTNQFRASGDSWIYNLDTAALRLTTNSCYRLDVYLNGVRISTQQFAVVKPIR